MGRLPAQREVELAGAAVAPRGAQIERHLAIEPQAYRTLAGTDRDPARADRVRQFVQIAGDLLRRPVGARLDVRTGMPSLAPLLVTSMAMMVAVMVALSAVVVAVVTRSGVCVMRHGLLLFCMLLDVLQLVQVGLGHLTLAVPLLPIVIRRLAIGADERVPEPGVERAGRA